MESPRLEIDADNIAWVTFDSPDSKVNILNFPVMETLEKILDRLTVQNPKRVIFISAKPGNFIAGADIKELQKFRDAAHAEELSRVGHRIFAKIEALPSVAAIDGSCLGGGCELALACRYRVATDNPKTQIGLPETQLGIIPGWGGTQRLPALIGLAEALEIIVPGKSLDGTRAFKIGLVDAVVPPVALRETAVKISSRNSRASTWPPAFIVRALARKVTMKKTRGFYPAPLAAIEVAGRGFEAEAKAFGQIAMTPECRNLIRLFFLREKYSKMKGLEGWKAGKVGVLGAGTMGAGIAMWCSARGLNVRLKDIKPEFVAAGMKRIEDAYRDGVKRHKISELQMQHGMARVHPTTDYTGFGDCDMVIEAVLEKIEVKRPVFNELTPLLRKNCIIASNTSAIPIDDLAAATGQPERFVGIHFFNPVHKMPLVEVVRGTKTTPEVVGAAVEFAKQLKKIPVVVKGAPGFLVNRLLMPYLNEAGVMLGEGVGVEAMDKAMLDFGWPMGPARLIDEIGIDVTLDVARELAEAFRDRMIVAPILRQVHEQGLKGRKGGAGFYVGDQVNPAVKLPGGKNMSREEIQNRLMNAMVAEAKLCMKEGIVAAEDDIDVAVIFGLGFPPFRGGLVKWARDVGVWS